MQVSLLGGVRVVSGDGAPVDVGPAKCQAVLAALALSAGSVVPVSRIVELVWGAAEPRTADKSLQSYIVRLRKSLGPDMIVRSGSAYGLAVEAGSVDVVRFQRHLDAGDIEAALGEWAGPPLAGLETGGLAATVDGLIEQWLGAVEIHLERLIETDTPAAIGSLTELTASHPFREGLWALLMTALYKVGRQADALAAYRRAREHLVEELGIEPGPALRELENLILDHDEQLTVLPASPAIVSRIPTGTVTFAFSDVEGSARLWAGDRRQTALAMARHDEVVRSAATDHDGHLFSTGGDSVGVAFHRASDAVAWATALQDAVKNERWPDDAEIRVRIGMHTGEAEERGDDYFGSAPNVAARIASAGHGGQTLLSSNTAGLLDGHVVHNLGTLRLDDLGTNHDIHQLGDGAYPPLLTGHRQSGNLPRRSGRLIGRDENLDTVTAALRTSPIVTLVGPGGIGKTRLALAAARIAEVDLSGGVWLVELADITSSGDVANAVAIALDLKDGPGRSPTPSILKALQSVEGLLLLDNCEHVIDGAAELASAVVEHCPEMTVLATSREGIGLAVEQLIAVGPLDATGVGVELFNERAAAVDPSYDAEANQSAVEEICRRLDGVPLAIELAAARVRTLTPSDLVARLDDRLRLLSGGRRRSVERHRTLRATISWSYDLLSAPQRMLFRRLSIFAGSFDLEAGEIVASDDELDAADVDTLLGDLVDRSMVVVESGPHGRRFRLLETIRQFGADHLSDAGSSDIIAERHAHYVLARVERIGELLAGHAELEGVAHLIELWPNLRAAVGWACTIGDVELATGLVGPVAAQAFVRRGMGEIGDWAERVLSVTPSDDVETRARCLLWVGFRDTLTEDQERYAHLWARHGDPDHVLARYARLAVDDAENAAEIGPLAIMALRERGDELTASLIEIFLMGALLGRGRLEDAEAQAVALTERFRADGPPTFLNWTLFMQGANASFQGDHERADQLYEESASVEVPARTNSPNEVLEARAAFRRGDHRRAFQVLRSYIDEILDADFMQGTELVCIEFIRMMTEIDHLLPAGYILGHLDLTGLLDVEGPGFKMLLVDAAERVASDPAATAARNEAVESDLDERNALVSMRDVLDQLIEERSAISST